MTSIRISGKKKLVPTLIFLTQLPDDKFFLSKFKQSADNNLKFYENDQKFSRWIENTVGKGEIASYAQFLLFPQCFQRGCLFGVSKGVIVLTNKVRNKERNE